MYPWKKGFILLWKWDHECISAVRFGGTVKLNSDPRKYVPLEQIFQNNHERFGPTLKKLFSFHAC